ncbi:MAG: UPF0182 family protein [Alicyclobacillaceae bacterium]|nr:UPF0182 family protein [Alicyclobacillaceae bacterium]
MAVAAVLNVIINQLFQYRLHSSLGYGSVFAKNLWLGLPVRYLGASLYAACALWGLRPLAGAVPQALIRSLRWVLGLVGWWIGYGVWKVDAPLWYAALSHLPFGRRDPLLHLDDAFYVYDLPWLEGWAGRLLGAVVLFALSRLTAVAVWWAKQRGVQRGSAPSAIVKQQLRALCVAAAAGFFLCAAFAWLNRFETVLGGGNGSFVFGPEFVTARIVLPVFSWLKVAALLAASFACAWKAVRPEGLLAERDGFLRVRWRGWVRPVACLALFPAVSLVQAIVAGLVNALYVHPNQNTVELPYIADTIQATRWAVGVEHVRTQPFVPSGRLTQAMVAREQDALANVRINDQGQTTAIFNQLQSFKSYFRFTPAAVDHYGRSQVYSAVREMNVDEVPVQTWVNRTLVYTHGYGMAVSPVNRFDSDGLPVLWAGNTPQQTQSPVPRITQPQEYFGLMDNDVIAPTREPEFDYPVGTGEHSSHYRGGFGLPVRGNRWLLTLELGTLRFYTSDVITSQSQYLFDRNIYRRAQDIAPFLQYDENAFPFVDSRGHILWMFDAYTQTPNIPYAEHHLGTAYIRNSVKVVVDAYSGQTTFYAIDPSDPMLKTWDRLYPGLFTWRVPDDVAAHFRYPLDLFQAQAQTLTRYHMTDPQAFYNQDDLWAVARQIYQQNEVVQRPPVFQEIRMPGQSRPHFVVSALFTPANKDNLNGWLVVDNEPGQYGRITLYQFPQSEWVTGPLQAENQIDADPAISQQLTLWNQQGSQVVRGDLLLIPVGRAVLYIEPVYLVANRENSLPQLQRVIVDFNQQVRMGNSLGDALAQLWASGTGSSGTAGRSGGGQAPSGLGGLPGTAPAGSGAGGTGAGLQGPAGTVQALAEQASRLLARYQADTARGDFEQAGSDLHQLEQVIAALRQAAGGQTATR